MVQQEPWTYLVVSEVKWKQEFESMRVVKLNKVLPNERTWCCCDQCERLK